MFYQVDVQLGNLPIVMHCLFPQGSVSFSKMVNYPPFFDLEQEGEIRGEFFPDGFSLHSKTGSEDFFFRTIYEYKKIPILLTWLQSLKLENPIRSKGA